MVFDLHLQEGDFGGFLHHQRVCLSLFLCVYESLDCWGKRVMDLPPTPDAHDGVQSHQRQRINSHIKELSLPCKGSGSCFNHVGY